MVLRTAATMRLAKPRRRARSHQRQTCKRCGRVQDEVDYVTSDLTWNAAVPARWSGRAICLACFDQLAAERGLHVVKVFLVNGP